MLASLGGSMDEGGEGGADAAGTNGQLYSSFDDQGDEESFLMALRQSKRKSIRQVGAGGLALQGGAAPAAWCLANALGLAGHAVCVCSGPAEPASCCCTASPRPAGAQEGGAGRGAALPAPDGGRHQGQALGRLLLFLP